MTLDSIIDFVGTLTLLKVFIACCISIVPLMVLGLAINNNRIQNHPLTVGMPVLVGLIANAAFTGMTLVVSMIWGGVDFLLLVHVPGEWIGIAAIIFVLFGLANAFDRSAF